MRRQQDYAHDASPALSCNEPASRGTHPRRPVDDSPPRDWSQMGRRILAEAWRRITDDLAARHTPGPETNAPRPGTEDAT
jgi:hypothetical protein